MKRYAVVPTIGFLALGLGCAERQALDRDPDALILQDRARVKKSLNEMDPVTREIQRVRLSLVRKEGISGLPRNAKPPMPGEMAPDFALRPLEFYSLGDDSAEATAENPDDPYQPVQLSGFRGRKPVVLIFGSYT